MPSFLKPIASKLISQAMQSQAQPQDPWGTEGDPYAKYRAMQDAWLANRAAPEDAAPTQAAIDYMGLPDNPVDEWRSVTINGQQFYRLGGLGQSGASRAGDLMLANATYDPKYGYVIPQAIKNQADQLHVADYGGNSFLDRLGNAGPAIMASAMGGAAAAGVGGGAGAAASGAGAGATGAGGFAAADAAGLAAMGADAGLSGAALDAFVANGGTLGSTAAGGGGIGLGAAATQGGGGALPESYWSATADAGGTVTDAAAANAGTVSASPGAETFVDPWDVMGDTSAYGLNPQPASPSIINDGMAGANTPAAAPEAVTAAEPVAAPSAPSAPAAPSAATADIGAQQAADAVAQTTYDAAAAGGAAGYDPSLVSGASQSTGGLLDAAIDWAKNNQTLASTGVTVAGGIIKGAMSPTPKEQADAVMQAKLQAETQAAAAKRASNRLENISLSRLRPTGATLQRPTGLIAGAMR